MCHYELKLFLWFYRKGLFIFCLQPPGRSPILAPEGRTSRSYPLSTQAAVNILQTSGNPMGAQLAIRVNVQLAKCWKVYRL